MHCPGFILFPVLFFFPILIFLFLLFCVCYLHISKSGSYWKPCPYINAAQSVSAIVENDMSLFGLIAKGQFPNYAALVAELRHLVFYLVDGGFSSFEFDAAKRDTDAGILKSICHIGPVSDSWNATNRLFYDDEQNTGSVDASIFLETTAAMTKERVQGVFRNMITKSPPYGVFMTRDAQPICLLDSVNFCSSTR